MIRTGYLTVIAKMRPTTVQGRVHKQPKKKRVTVVKTENTIAPIV